MTVPNLFSTKNEEEKKITRFSISTEIFFFFCSLFNFHRVGASHIHKRILYVEGIKEWIVSVLRHISFGYLCFSVMAMMRMVMGFVEIIRSP